MKRRLLLSLIFICMTIVSYGQKSNKSYFTPTKYGIQFLQGNENNFLFDDADYFYRTNTVKGQLYFPITKLKTVEISLVVQPQIQFVQHQLYNEQFVRPEEPNYLEKRARFTKLKNLSISALEFSVEAKQKLFKRVAIFIQVSLGFGYIDTETERLAKGFTFIENGNLGLDILISSKLSFQIFGGVGHISNFNFQMPNSGYNILNSGIGFVYQLN